ncbi:pyridoxal phosphate-dependent transferase [Geopyxis carbonaria]|nr:pyridoxal phosphate-dependent transferase [Geopyxis carbonaria]
MATHEPGHAITPPHPVNNDSTQAVYTSAWTHRADIVYMDHGAFGGVPATVMAAQTAIRRRIEEDPHNFFERSFPAELQRSKEALARFLRCDVAGLVLVPGATHAMNIVIHSQRFQPGDEIVTTDHAYSSVKMALDTVAARDGAIVRVATVPFPSKGDDEVVAAIEAQLSPRTKFAVIDHLPSRSALIFPIARIVSNLEARGIEVLVDGAHAPGMIELDVAAINAPYYVANCHKWMCSPRGIGFIHVRADRHTQLRPLVVARSPHMVNRGAFSPLQHAFDWLGTTDPSAYLSIPAVIEFLETLMPGGYPELVKRNHDIAIKARTLLCETLNIPEPCPEHMIGCMSTMPLPDTIGPQREGMLPLQRRLWDEFRCQMPVYAWPTHPRRVFRISVQAFNFWKQYEWLAEVMKGCLPDGPKLNGATLLYPSPRTQSLSTRPSTASTLTSQGCLDPYVSSALSPSSSNTPPQPPPPKHPTAELTDPTIDDLQILSLLRIVSSIPLPSSPRTLPPPPLLFPTAAHKSAGCWTAFHDLETEAARMRYTLGTFPERGVPASCAPVVAALLADCALGADVLAAWPTVAGELRALCRDEGLRLLEQHSRPPTPPADDGALAKSAFSATIIPYATLPASPTTPNLALSLWTAALAAAAHALSTNTTTHLPSFLSIHSFLLDPLSSPSVPPARQLTAFHALLTSFMTDHAPLHPLTPHSWQSVAAQLAAESAWLGIKKLHKVAHVQFVAHQQLTYVYVTLDHLHRAEFSMPARVLELVRELLAAAGELIVGGVCIAPVTVTYCRSLTRGLGKKWLTDVTAALHALLACPMTLAAVAAARQSAALTRFARVKKIPALVTEEARFQTVWVAGAGERQGEGVKLLQPVQQTVFSTRGVRVAIPAKGQSHGRSLGYRALPVRW